MPQRIDPITAKVKPHAKIIKLCLPLISLKSIMPQRAEIADGPLETIGNVIACVKELLAKKKLLLAIPHIHPLK